jgi:hypothetical protein
MGSREAVTPCSPNTVEVAMEHVLLQSNQRRLWQGLAIALVAVVAFLLAPQPASALTALPGASVARHCGVNQIASWNDGGGGHARTARASGTCEGPLSVAAVRGSTIGARLTGSASFAQVNAGPTSITGGRHWGCPTCNVSLS